MFDELINKLHEVTKEFEGNQTVDNYGKVQEALYCIEQIALDSIIEYID